MADPYASVQQLKAWLAIPDEDETDDELLELAVGSATTAIDQATGQTFGGEGAEVPDVIQMATLLQAARFFKRKGAPFGIAGSPEMGSELRLLSRLDPDVELMLFGQRRIWGAV